MVIFILLIQPILVRIGTRHHDILYLTIFSYFSSFLTAWQIFFCFRSKWFSKRISRDGKRYFATVDFFQFQHISYELINFYMSAQSSFHSWIVFLVSFCSALCCLMLFFTISALHTQCNFLLSFPCCLVLCHTLLCCFMLSFTISAWHTLCNRLLSFPCCLVLCDTLLCCFMLSFTISAWLTLCNVLLSFLCSLILS